MGVIKGDIRGLDYSSYDPYSVLGLGFIIRVLPCESLKGFLFFPFEKLPRQQQPFLSFALPRILAKHS